MCLFYVHERENEPCSLIEIKKSVCSGKEIATVRMSLIWSERERERGEGESEREHGAS